MKIAMVQVASPDAEPVDARRERVGAMVAKAQGADLITLPELWGPGYFAFGNYARDAESLDGATVAAGCSWARALRAWLHLGSIIEGAANGRVHNTAVLIDPHGAVVHLYRKVHVFGIGSLEARLVSAGDSVSVVAAPLGRTGATTCYDLRFPELWRTLVDAGAEAVIVPAAWPAGRLDHWCLLTSARAVEQQITVVATNATGEHGGVTVAGHSRVVGPWGEVLAEAGVEEGITWAEVDPAVTGEVRARFPVLDDRRTGSIRIDSIQP